MVLSGIMVISMTDRVQNLILMRELDSKRNSSADRFCCFETKTGADLVDNLKNFGFVRTAKKWRFYRFHQKKRI